MRSLSSFRDPALHPTHSPRAGDPSRSVQPDRALHTMFHRVCRSRISGPIGCATRSSSFPPDRQFPAGSARIDAAAGPATVLPPSSMLPDFKLERFFARWEFAVRHVACASDVEPVPMRDLLAMADDEMRERWDGL